jgi:EAL domain-containing protein (putative c-di-GMP-specific phosphodiesterase class I)
MYQAKEAGRDTVAVFDTSMRERIADRLALEHDLRLAVEREEFRLVYQPILSLTEHGHQVMGLEALLRWEGPTRGLVPPGMFISIAEDSGLIVEIGDWVIHEACRQLARWRTEPGLEELYCSVNVSALQLKKASLFPRVRQALAESSLPPEALCIELTESLLMESPAEGTALLGRLKELGVRLALDDFGTGYSSLAYLKQFPVDYVKIDQSFIRGLSHSDSSDETLVAAVVSMARALGAITVAEGVEEPEQLARLRDIGVDCAQGFYFARPVLANQVVATIRTLSPHRGLRLVSGRAGGGASVH